MTSKRPRIVIEDGHVTLESRQSPVKVTIFVHEHDDGGLYFELAATEGSFRPQALPRERSRSLIVFHRPEDTSDES